MTEQRHYPLEEEHIVVTVWMPGGEHNDRNYVFKDWERACEVALNRAQEGFHTKVKRRYSKHTAWEEKEFYPTS